ncbi:alginate export family protein [Lichenicola sp.]|uniref:alginate export family protein n=1 Tax=Lichenicola sp. TaxID=2804529 RepID=UPI003B00AF12
MVKILIPTACGMTRVLQSLLLGAGVGALVHVHAAAAQTATSQPPAAAGAAVSVPTAPSLLDRPPASTLPETVQLPTKAQAPTVVHQGDWGVFNGNDGTAAGFGPVARYGVSRWAEDWQVLRDPSKRDDFFDPLKFIALNDSKSIYLTLSLDERLRNWFENRPFLGKQKPYDSGRMTVRGLYGADLHLGEHLRVYAELINGDAAGWAGYGYNTLYRKRLDLQQAFIEAKATLLGARTGVILGRQSFLDGPAYLLSNRDQSNVPITWDGVRAYAIWQRARLDVFDFVQTNTTETKMFHDNQNWNSRMFGAYESWALPSFKVDRQPGQVFLDFYYYGYLLGGSSAAIPTAKISATQAGSTLRHNPGTRLWGKAGPVEFSLGALYQGGEFRPAKSNVSRDVSAFAANSFVGVRLAQVIGKPILGVQTDIYSGGNYKEKTGSVGTFIAPYSPVCGYTDMTTYITEANLVATSPVLEVAPIPRLFVRVKAPVLWRESTNDAVYGSGRIYSFRGNFSGGYIGTVPQMSAALKITRHLTWTNDVARFLASSQFQKAGAQNGTYYMSTVDFRF